MRRATPAELATVWRGGVGAVSAFYGSLSDTEFMTREHRYVALRMTQHLRRR